VVLQSGLRLLHKTTPATAIVRATTDTTIGIDIAAVEFRPPFELTATMMVVVAIAVCEKEPVREAVWVFEGDTIGVNDEVVGVTGVVVLVVLMLVVLVVLVVPVVPVLLVIGTVEVLEALRQRGSAVQIHSVRTYNL